MESAAGLPLDCGLHRPSYFNDFFSENTSHFDEIFIIRSKNTRLDPDFFPDFLNHALY